jgi:ubiquinone/menaquinone biosynthesis C-methylase UbiE
VTSDDAVALLAPAIATRGGVWADLGAGDGTFTRALAQLLGPTSQIYAVDRDGDAIAALKRWAASAPSKVIPVVGDFSLPFDPPRSALLDGMLFANSLHYVRDAEHVLARLAAWLKPGGRTVIVEYERRRANRWVPHPIPIAKLSALTTAAGLSAPTVVARRPSIYEGELYVAVAYRPKGVAEP